MTLTFLLSGDAHGTPCPPLPTALHAPVCVDFGWFKALGVLCERSMWSAKFCWRVLIRKGKWVRDCCSSSAPQMQWSRLKLKDRILLSHWEVNLISSTPNKMNLQDLMDTLRNFGTKWPKYCSQRMTRRLLCHTTFLFFWHLKIGISNIGVFRQLSRIRWWEIS